MKVMMTVMALVFAVLSTIKWGVDRHAAALQQAKLISSHD